MLPWLWVMVFLLLKVPSLILVMFDFKPFSQYRKRRGLGVLSAIASLLC